jgi:hypothetical protein
MTQVRRLHPPHLIVAFGLLLGGGGKAIGASPEITENTACTAVVGSFDAKDLEKMGAIAGVAMMVMQEIDPDYAKKLPQTEKWRGKELALIICEDHPTWTLGRAIEETYKELLVIPALPQPALIERRASMASVSACKCGKQWRRCRCQSPCPSACRCLPHLRAAVAGAGRGGSLSPRRLFGEEALGVEASRFGVAHDAEGAGRILTGHDDAGTKVRLTHKRIPDQAVAVELQERRPKMAREVAAK